jgi:pyruvate dehydrogenase E1 component alpha subunit
MTVVVTSPASTEPRAAEPAHSLYLLREMMRIRRFEEKCAEQYAASKIRGFLHLYVGEEAIAIGAMQALQPEDWIVATYREHGQALARGISMKSIMAEMYGKVEGCSRGRGGSMHLFDRATRFCGGNAIVGGGIPLAVGLALADQMQHRQAITACFFGDGAAAEGVFAESLNLAALWHLPVLFLCENNQYAMGTALRYSHANTDLCEKMAGFGVPCQPVDGMDVLTVEDATRQAANRVRAGSGPLFLEYRTYRFRAHSAFDAELYRTKEEVEEWKRRDPIPALADHLKRSGVLTDAELSRMEADIDAEVEEAVAYAETSTWEPVEELTRFVYSEAAQS